jgi:predicted DCC family thiol-disulfide oxidoreductase YuxK
MILPAPPLVRSLMIFDGDCGFCRAGIARWRGRTGASVDYAPYQEVGARFPQIASGAFAQAVHLVEPDGTVSRAAAAVFRALEMGGHPLGARLYRASGLVRVMSEAAYRWVAAHRVWLGRRLGLEACRISPGQGRMTGS